DVRRVGATRGRDVTGVGGRLSPARLLHLTDPIYPRSQTREAVVAAGDGGGRGVHRPVGALVQLDRPVDQAWFPGVLHAVAIQVVELLTADRYLLEVPEVDVRRVGATRGR